MYTIYTDAFNLLTWFNERTGLFQQLTLGHSARLVISTGRSQKK